MKFLSVLSSFAWGGKVVEQLGAMLANLHAEMLPPVLCKGLPGENELQAVEKLADAISEKHGICMMTKSKSVQERE